jgi:hypothetical protein
MAWTLHHCKKSLAGIYNKKVQKERIKGKGRQRGERAGKEGIDTSNSTFAAELLNKIEYKASLLICKILLTNCHKTLQNSLSGILPQALLSMLLCR